MDVAASSWSSFCCAVPTLVYALSPALLRDSSYRLGRHLATQSSRTHGRCKHVLAVESRGHDCHRGIPWMETERDRLRRSVCGSHRDQITGLVSHAVLQNLLDALAPTSTGPIRVSHKGANESVSAPSFSKQTPRRRARITGQVRNCRLVSRMGSSALRRSSSSAAGG